MAKINQNNDGTQYENDQEIPRAGQEIPTPQPAEQRTTRSSELLSVREIFADFSVDGGLSEAAAEYRDQIYKVLNDKVSSRLTTGVEMRTIINNITVFYTPTHAIAMVFESTSSYMNEDLRDFANNTVIADTRRYAENEPLLKGHTILDVLFITREMLNRAGNMSNYIRNKFLAIEKREYLSSVSISKYSGPRVSISVDASPAHVKQYFNQHSPVGTNPCQFGFIAKRVEMIDTPGNSNRQAREAMDLFAVSAYVEFVARESSGYSSRFSRSRARKYRPVVHISEIHSSIPTANISALILAVATEVFITRELWRQPFVEGTDCGDIVNLIVDPETGNPAVGMNANDVELAFREAITYDDSGNASVCLAIDTVAGQPQYVNLGRIVNNEGKAAFASELGNFLNDTETKNDIARIAQRDGGAAIAEEKNSTLDYLCNAEYAGMNYTSVIGISLIKDRSVDTRDFTYLKALAEKLPPNDAYELTHIDGDERRAWRHVEVVNRITNNSARPTAKMCTTLFNQLATVNLGTYVCDNVQLVFASQAHELSYIGPPQLDSVAISAGANRSQRQTRTYGSTQFDM